MNVDEELLQRIRDEYFEPKGDWAQSRVERVTRAAGVLPDERVLDLGCAFGTFSYHTHRAGARAVGLDRKESSLLAGREISLHVGGFATPRVRGDARRLPFRSGCFDLVINADFIEHTDEEAKSEIFSEMYRVMRSGGRGVVYTPNLNRVLWELRGERVKRWMGMRRERVPHWRAFVDADHFGLTTPRRTEGQLRSVGFETRILYYEFHFPLLSGIPGFNRLFGWFLSPQFANRFLIKVHKR